MISWPRDEDRGGGHDVAPGSGAGDSDQAAALGVAKLPNAIDWLESRIKVDGRDNSEVIEVSMTGDKPAQVTILVNAVVNAYLKRFVEKETQEKQKALEE